MSAALAVLGLVLLAVWIKVCERLIIRDIDNSLMTGWERAKREKCHD